LSINFKKIILCFLHGPFRDFLFTLTPLTKKNDLNNNLYFKKKKQKEEKFCFIIQSIEEKKLLIRICFLRERERE
jgi:hypothetical protein